MKAVELFENPVLDEVAAFAANNKNSGPRFAALHAVLTERVLPPRAKYRAALDAAAKEKIEMEHRHADSLRTRAACVEQLKALDRFVADKMPAEVSAAKAAPARIAEETNESLAPDEIALVASAIGTLSAFRA
jgi:hypothetical protein